MKQLLTAAIIILSLNATAQDTAHVRNLSLQARVIEYMTPYMANITNDSLYTTFLDLRTKFRAIRPQGTTLVVVDSIPTFELAALYNYALSSPDGMAVATLFKNQIATKRAGNPYLDRLATAAEDFWTDRLKLMRLQGRKLLLGRD